MCRTLLFSLTNAEEGDEVPEKPTAWRSQCSAVLYQPISAINSWLIVANLATNIGHFLQVRTVDDACIFFLAGFPKDTFSVLEKVFDMYSRGKVKGLVAKLGSLGKMLDLKGSNFKHMRGLDAEMIAKLLQDVAERKTSVSEMAGECLNVKRLRDLQAAFIKETGMASWEDAKAKFPESTTPEAFDEFLLPRTSNKSLTPRFV